MYSKAEVDVIVEALTKTVVGDRKVVKFGDAQPDDSKARGDARKMIKSVETYHPKHPPLRTAVKVASEGDNVTYHGAVALKPVD